MYSWRTDADALIASISRHDDVYRMVWPGLGLYCFSALAPFVTAFPDPHVSHDAMASTFLRTVLPMAMQALGYEALHASAIVHPTRGVIVLAGRSLEGKSTLALGLTTQSTQAVRSDRSPNSRLPFRQWADDGVVWRIDASGTGSVATAVPLPFKPRLRAASTGMIRECLLSGAVPPPRSTAPNPASAARRDTPVGAICLLERSETMSPGEPAATLTPLREAEAFSSVLAHAYELDPFDADRRVTMLRAYLELVAVVPVFTLRFRSGGAHLANVLDAIAHDLDAQLEGACLCAPL